MSGKNIQRSITMTQEMRDRLTQLVSKQPRSVTESDLIREAIRRYLDEQEDITGSRKHFQKSFQDRLDRLEAALAFQLNVLIYLIATDDPEIHQTLIHNAIIDARRAGETLLAQMKAVRELK